MLRIAITFAGLVAAFSSPAAAQNFQELRENCSPESARPVTVAQLHADDNLRFQCVSVEGVLDGGTFYEHRAAIVTPIGPFDEEDFEEGAIRGAARANTEAPNRISLQRSTIPQGEGPLTARIVGVVNNCAAIQDEADARIAARSRETGEVYISFIGGTCHYHSEVYLDPVTVTFLSFDPLFRYTAEEIEPGQSDLVQFSEEELPDGMDLKFADLMLRAIAEGDQAAFMIAASASNRPDNFELPADLHIQASVVHEGGRRDARLEIGEQSFARARYDREMWQRAHGVRYQAQKVRDTEAPERRLYFLQSTIDYELLYPEDDFSREVIACWCKTEDCSGKWPVFSGDADALFRRPYFCLTVEQSSVRGRENPQTYVSLPSTEYGFAEPDWDGDGDPG